jgi:6-phosphogluconolactonase
MTRSQTSAGRQGPSGELRCGERELLSWGKETENLASVAEPGTWLLCANLAGDTVAVFRIDAKTGRLKAAGEPVRQSSPSGIMPLP